MDFEHPRIVTGDHPPAAITGPLSALWYAGKGDWKRAHAIAQDIENEGGILGACLSASSGRRPRKCQLLVWQGGQKDAIEHVGRGMTAMVTLLLDVK